MENKQTAMTPKEKAEELFRKMYSTYSYPFDITVRRSSAKQCALIAVDEILDEFQGIHTYWIEVKQEIEKL